MERERGSVSCIGNAAAAPERQERNSKRRRRSSGSGSGSSMRRKRKGDREGSRWRWRKERGGIVRGKSGGLQRKRGGHPKRAVRQREHEKRVSEDVRNE